MRNKQQHETELQIATDNQREVALQAYIDKISELLLEKKLRESTEDDEARTIARVRTLTVLRGLDAIRKASVLQFLHESGLIGKDTRIISLQGADLSGAHLSSADLRYADFIGANLRYAHLSSANLEGAYLNEAKLSGAKLNEANLRYADLSDADLNRANLKGAIGVTIEELEKQAASLNGVWQGFVPTTAIFVSCLNNLSRS